MSTGEVDVTLLLDTYGFELGLWHLNLHTTGSAKGGPDAVTDEPSVNIAEGRWTVVEWDTPVTLHYAEDPE